MKPQHAEGYVPALDGIRGIAIGWVMLYHFWRYSGPDPLGAGLREFAGSGWAGVDIFFALSGFLITGTLLDSRHSLHYWRNFYIRRSLRIFPLYYTVMTLVVLGGLAAAWLGYSGSPQVRVENAWVNYLYLTNFAIAFNGHDWAPLDIAWTLAMEEQFYLVLPFLVYSLKLRTLVYCLLAACVLAPLLRLLAFAWSDHLYYVPYVLPFCRMDNLAVGGLAACLLRYGPDGLKQGVARSAAWLWIAAGIAHALWGRSDLPFVAVGYSLVAMATAATIVRLFTQPSAWLRPALSLRPLVYIGKISYGLYLLHLFTRVAVDYGPLRNVFAGYTQNLPLALLRLALLTGLSVTAAAVSWKFFEQPVLRLKHRFAPAPGTSPVPGQS